MSGDLFGSLDGNFAELFEILHQVQGSFTGTATGSFVSFNDLSLSVGRKFFDLSFDLFNKFFHFFNIYKG